MIRLAVLAIGLAGCTSDRINVGAIALDPDGAAQVVVPTSAQIGVPFVVSLSTVGSGCVHMESTEVEYTLDGADVIPFDRLRNPGGTITCGGLPKLIAHEASVTFTTGGTRRIHVRARVEGSSSDAVVDIPFAVNVESRRRQRQSASASPSSSPSIVFVSNERRVR